VPGTLSRTIRIPIEYAAVGTVAMAPHAIGVARDHPKHDPDLEALETHALCVSWFLR